MTLGSLGNAPLHCGRRLKKCARLCTCFYMGEKADVSPDDCADHKYACNTPRKRAKMDPAEIRTATSSENSKASRSTQLRDLVSWQPILLWLVLPRGLCILMWLSWSIHHQAVAWMAENVPACKENLVSAADGIGLRRPSGAGAALPWHKHSW
jgi:hypothetical protein